jgi:hypothetical protein
MEAAGPRWPVFCEIFLRRRSSFISLEPRWSFTILPCEPCGLRKCSFLLQSGSQEETDSPGKIVQPMPLRIENRTAVKKLLGPRLTSNVRQCFRQRLPGINSLLIQFNGLQALEIGGPSPLFSEDGSLPVYCMCSRVDNCLFSTKTI